MSKLKQLAQSIQSAGFKVEPQRSKHWIEVEQMIDQMTSKDFAITYGKDVRPYDIPLFNIMTHHLPYLAEKMIRKNPMFAAKIIDNNGWTVLHHACINLLADEAIKIINLIFPYMSQEAILMQGINNNDTFLHLASSKKMYKVSSCIPPEVISIIVKKSAVVPSSYVSMVKFLKEAIQIYDIEIILFSEEPDNYFRKGIILQGMGKEEKAIKCYKKAIELDRSYTEKVKEVDLIKITEGMPQHNSNPEFLKSKIDELTKEISELNEKKLSLSMELAKFSSPQKTIEEHKGERVDEVPPYEEDDVPLPDVLGLVGDTCDVTLHA